MVSPVVDQGAVTKDIYFPDARWFDISEYTTKGTVAEVSTRGAYETVGKVLGWISIFLFLFYSCSCPWIDGPQNVVLPVKHDPSFFIKLKFNFYFLDCPLDKIPIHVRGGSIFPLQTEAVNTQLSRQNPWQLLVALDDNEMAAGQLFMDDGVSQDTIQNGNHFLVILILEALQFNHSVLAVSLLF